MTSIYECNSFLNAKFTVQLIIQLIGEGMVKLLLCVLYKICSAGEIPRGGRWGGRGGGQGRETMKCDSIVLLMRINLYCIVLYRIVKLPRCILAACLV